MNYYRFDLQDHPGREILVRMPESAAVLFAQQPQVKNLTQISRSTYYRIQQRDARAFWQAIDASLETAE